MRVRLTSTRILSAPGGHRDHPHNRTHTRNRGHPYDHSRLSYLLPRNHHGDQVAPLTADGQPYRFCWTDPGQAMVYAETADDLLAYWIPQYQGAGSAGRARLRAEHALQIRPNIIAGLIVTADQEGCGFENLESWVVVGSFLASSEVGQLGSASLL